MTLDRRTTLLLGDGLSPGVDATTRQRLVEHVMKDFARAQRAQSRAVRAWVVHSGLFALLWVVHFKEHGRAFAYLIGSRIEGIGVTRDAPLLSLSNEGMYKIGDVVLSALYWSNGIAFLIALLFTVLYLVRSRGAESGVAMIDLLAKSSR